MRLHRSALQSIAAGVLAISTVARLPGAIAQTKEAVVRTSSEGGVTVAVTPLPTAGGVRTRRPGGAPGAGPPRATAADRDWEFTVALDTHSQDLNDDLVAVSVLLVNGAEVKPKAWTGAAAGGHHREGVLVFAPLAGPTGTVELRIQRPSEAQPRSFRWDGTDLR